MSNIYTKTGDYGETHMGVHRISKVHPIIDLMGGLDELSAHLGMVIALIRDNESVDNIATEKLVKPLMDAQYILYVLSANIHKHFCKLSDTQIIVEPNYFGLQTLWTYIKSLYYPEKQETCGSHGFCELSRSVSPQKLETARKSKNVISLEQSMDEMENSGLQPLRHFIRPTGNPCTCELHICRTVCRRVERLLWSTKEYQNFDCYEDLVYLNRLSDWLFVCARYIKMLSNENEEYFSM